AQHAARDWHGRPHSGIHQARQGQKRFLPPDGLRPSRLQELRPARQDHAEDLPRGVGRTWRQGRSAARRRPGARKNRAARRLFPGEEALSQYRLLFGHHTQGDGLPDHDVHGAVCGGAYRRLDRAMEGNDRGPEAENRPPAPTLYRRDAAGLRAYFATEILTGFAVRALAIELRRFGAIVSPLHVNAGPGEAATESGEHHAVAAL